MWVAKTWCFVVTIFNTAGRIHAERHGTGQLSEMVSKVSQAAKSLAGIDKEEKSLSSSSSLQSNGTENQQAVGTEMTANTSPIVHVDSDNPPPPESIRLKPRTIAFNIMVAGLSGLGKSTMCAQLLESWCGNVAAPTGVLADGSSRKSTLQIDPSRTFERYDKATNTILKVRIIDTPGFGNRIDHRDAVSPVLKYIYRCRDRQFAAEMSPNKGRDENDADAVDSLVHVCLYFLSPGRFLEIDKHFLRKVQNEVVIIPVISKADTLTNDEISNYREMLSQVFDKERINVYDLDNYKADRASAYGNSKYFHRGRRAGEALAVISRDGSYPWGRSRSFYPEHSDLKLIRDVLLSYHTERFIELAQAKYATYRSRRMKRERIARKLPYALLFGTILLLRNPGESYDEENAQLLERWFWNSRSKLIGVSKVIADSVRARISKFFRKESEDAKAEQCTTDAEGTSKDAPQASLGKRNASHVNPVLIWDLYHS